MISIDYDDIPLVPKHSYDRHGIFRNPAEYTLEIWIQGKRHFIVSGESYDFIISQEVFIHGVCETLLRPMIEGTPWQRVLVRQLIYPWTGRVI